ncbi:deoxyribonuclease V [Mucilaginibacter lacusdianchii]|uniref:deoxyribonuclease V n=1 Tax=Mucilaginibacter lacusdianchii TaxID=2684211 RepID=UPI00131AACBA|nr:deoxyribonuclease V [Mucilaginibacter sp. JXJ CY 39]
MEPADYENLTAEQAINYQQQLRSQIKLEPFDKPIQIIGGSDISFNKYSEVVYAGIVLLKYPEMEIIGHASAVSRTTFPYISGLLAFREVPALLEAWNKLETKPDILVLDGQGIAHRRRMGIASHFGVITNTPTIGSAKSRLFGRYDEPINVPMAQSPMTDKEETIGVALKSKKNCNPIFISPGHRITLEQSVDVIKNCLKGYRIPEPTRQAHILVNKLRVEMGGHDTSQLSIF